MNFKASNYHFNSSRTSTHQGHQLFKDFKGLHLLNSSRTSKDYITLRCNQGHRLFKDNNSSRTSTLLQGLHRLFKDYITLRCNQGHRLIKDIDSSRTSTLLQGLHHFTAITLILLWPQYRSMMTFCDTKRALQTNTDLALARMKKEI